MAMAVNTPEYELPDLAAAQGLRQVVLAAIAGDAEVAKLTGLEPVQLHAHCGICGAPREEWRYEVGWSKAFKDWDAAQAALKANEAQMLADRTVLDLLDLTYDARLGRILH